MLSKQIQKALNDQIQREANASYFYLAIASWCEYRGLDGSANFFYKQSEEERGHMLKIFHYINEAGGHAYTPLIAKTPREYKNITSIFELALKQEMDNTRSINKVVEICLKAKDYSTFNFLQWYVAEQHEEERAFKTILDKIKIIGVDGKGIYLIDKEIEKLAEKE
ncbi:MAG: ferritin [Cytophagales bacterium]|nr:ferritin [Cytophagales bacterium]